MTSVSFGLSNISIERVQLIFFLSFDLFFRFYKKRFFFFFFFFNVSRRLSHYSRFAHSCLCFCTLYVVVYFCGISASEFTSLQFSETMVIMHHQSYAFRFPNFYTPAPRIFAVNSSDSLCHPCMYM